MRLELNSLMHEICHRMAALQDIMSLNSIYSQFRTGRKILQMHEESGFEKRAVKWSNIAVRWEKNLDCETKIWRR